MAKTQNGKHPDKSEDKALLLLKPVTNLLTTTFNLQKVLGGPVLAAWLSAEGQLTSEEKAILDKL